MKKAVFFDFDGTITSEDSFNHFLYSRFGRANFLLALLMATPLIVRYLFDHSQVLAVKESLLSHFYKGKDYENFLKDAEMYGEKFLPRIIKKRALEELKKYDSKEIFVVSASPHEWIDLWGKKYRVIASEVSVKNGKLEGTFSYHCYGGEKPKIMKKFAANAFIIAYGDSPGDKPMLALADEAHYREL